MSPYDNAVLVEYGGRKWWGCCLATWTLFADDSPLLAELVKAGLALVVDEPVATPIIWRVSTRAAPQRLTVTHLFDAAVVDEYARALGRPPYPGRHDEPPLMSAITLSAAVGAWNDERKAAKKTFDELASRATSATAERVKRVLAGFVKMPNTQSTRDKIKAAVERELGVAVNVSFDVEGNVCVDVTA